MLPNRMFFHIYGPYLGRPILWPEIGRREFLQPLVRRLRPASPTRQDISDSKAEARAWCASMAIDTTVAIRQLGGDEALGQPLASRFPDAYAHANQQQADCPAEMGGAGNGRLLYALAAHLGATQVVETGVAYGWSSLAILLSLRDRPDARLFSVDLPYFHRRNDAWVGCVISPELLAQWRLYRMADREGLPRALRAAGRIDLAHYDSDKSVAGRAWAYPRLWAALRPGGILVSDDIGDNVAFRDFSAHTGAETIVVGEDNKYQGILVKPAK